ncbi:extracellular solute-binding protein [Olivibacter sp. CPCC 100613]|uniref:extracellular solute-binding protein n=1 Tax=Olivibacter sp. CPCC 100613 TaxID=3079931 RepID=UPI002FFBD69E
MKNRTLRIAVRKFEPFEKAMKHAWEVFCKSMNCPITVELVAMDLHELYEETIRKQGLKKGIWDIAHINTDWICEAYEREALYDLTPWLEENPPEDYPKGWSPSLLAMQNFDHRIMGLPFHDGPECLIYRKDLFELEANKLAFYSQFRRELTVPQTWDEYVEVARFFHRPAEKLFGTVMGIYADGHNAVFDFCLQLWSRQGNLVDEDGRIQLNTSEAKDALHFYKTLVKQSGCIHPNSFQYESVQAGEAFARGEAAMMVNWFGFATVCEVEEASKLKGKIDIAPVPAGNNGQGTSLNVYWLYTVGSGSQHASLAYDFIRFAMSKEMDKQLTLTGGIGCRLSTWNDPLINHLIPYYHKLEKLHERSHTLPRKKNWATIATRIDQLIQDVLAEKGTITELLMQAQVDINQLDNE